MRKSVMNWRMAVIFLLCTVAVLCIFSEPVNDETWYRDFFISKSIGAATAYCIYKLVKYWESKKLLPEWDLDEEV